MTALIRIASDPNRRQKALKIVKPFVKGRIIDLTRSAFSSIGDLDTGIINVTIEVIK